MPGRFSTFCNRVGSFIQTNIKASFETTRHKATRMGAQDLFLAGRYVTGLPVLNIPTDAVIECAVTDRDFVFLGSHHGLQVGRINRISVHSVVVEDKSQFSKRITVTRILALGLFALAVPKKTANESWYVVLNWKDERSAHQTIFRFTANDPQMHANNAAINFRRHVLSRSEPAAVSLPGKLAVNGSISFLENEEE
jgi:hypothetical protein